MRKWFAKFSAPTHPVTPPPKIEARDISVDFLGEIGKSRSIEDYLREIEKHRWELEHRINQIADHLSVARKFQTPTDSAGPASPSSTASQVHFDPIVDPERDRRRNLADAREHPEDVRNSEQAIEEYLSRLPARDDASAGHVPRIFHFVFGLKDEGDLPYYGYMAIKSARHFNPNWQVYFHCVKEPQGPRWSLIRDDIEVIRFRDFNYFKNSRFSHYAHKSDVIRLLAINRVGGVYLDIDTITRKSFEDLRDVSFCMGVQAGGNWSASGVCNAVLIGRPDAAFSTRWLEQYDYFKSRGRDSLWDYHSVKYPAILMAEHPEWITLLDYRAFFYPLWTNIEQQLFTESGYHKFKDHFSTAYCFHLWNGETRDFLETIDANFIRESKSIYAEIAREVEGMT
jgi:hypothetical protein